MQVKKFVQLKRPSSWRRLAIANWSAPDDPTVYGSFKVDFTQGKQFLAQQNQLHNENVTPTHLVAKALALTLVKFPDLNGIIKYQRIYLRSSVDIFLQVAIPPTNPDEKPDLSGAKIDNCDQKNLASIAHDLRAKSKSIRQHQDPQFNYTLNLLKWIPGYLLRVMLKVMGILIYHCGINAPKLGLPADPFGSAMVTSVGMLGLPAAYAPLVPISRCPLIVCVGEVSDQPWVDNGQVVVRPVLDLAVTFDHRFIDGWTGAQMANHFRSLLANPQAFSEMA